MMDEDIGNEVSRKIKAAIKAKLVELGVYVDDELPDYIMILVANQRSRHEMENDLALFLNNNTKIFTSWLYTVLEKLQQVTVAAIDKKSDGKKSKKRSSSVGSKSSDSSDKKSKKKKKRKDKKKRKHKKRKSKDSEDADEEVPKKKSRKERPDFIAKQVGKAIIGSLKEKHKNGETADENKIEETVNTVDEAVNEKLADEPKAKEPSPVVEVLQKPEPIVDIQENSEDLTVIAVKLNKQLPVMVPTRELLKEHDKLTEVKPEKKGSSEDSMTAEELRRELLLSRAKQKLKERNLATRVRSNSPEVLCVDDSNITQPSDLTVEKPKSENGSSKLSLRHSSLGSSSVNSDRPASPRSEEVSKKQVSSFIVKPAEPEQPGILSFVQVKPREFIPAEKQANKSLILKAVAAAERSIAKIPQPPVIKKATREPFSRDLRGNRFEKFSVTIQQTPRNHSLPEKNESFIQGWLDDVEEAGRQDTLIIPDDLDEPLTENHITEANPKTGNKLNRISDRFAKISKPHEDHKLKKEYQEFLRTRAKKRTGDGESKNLRLIAELSMKFGKVDEKITRKPSNDNVQSAN